MPKWTQQQQEAIESRGKSLIVCAAAGSGKTAVLVERIVQLVKEGCPIENMLVVTFTNAAAGEMRQRIGEALSRAAAENPALAEQVMALGADVEMECVTGVEQAGNSLQSGGVTCAVCTDQGNDLALFNIEADALEGLDAAVVDLQVGYFEHIHSSSTPRYAAITAGLSRTSAGVSLSPSVKRTGACRACRVWGTSAITRSQSSEQVLGKRSPVEPQVLFKEMVTISSPI